MWRIIILCIITSLAADDKVSYENYEVFSIVPTTQLQLEILQDLRDVIEVSKSFRQKRKHEKFICRFCLLLRN